VPAAITQVDAPTGSKFTVAMQFVSINDLSPTTETGAGAPSIPLSSCASATESQDLRFAGYPALAAYLLLRLGRDSTTPGELVPAPAAMRGSGR
jgi:type 1 fimbria pilin